MTDKQKKACHGIIHSHAVAAAGVAAGLAQIPGVDNAPLVAIEVAMTIELGAVFGIAVTKSSAMSVVAGAAGQTVGRAISQALLGWIPGFGNVINASTAAGVVEALGWTIANQFDAQST